MAKSVSGDDRPQNSSRQPAQMHAAAKRALAEAKERRAKHAGNHKPSEFGGRDGPDPARYGDWEVKGIASDF